MIVNIEGSTISSRIRAHRVAVTIQVLWDLQSQPLGRCLCRVHAPHAEGRHISRCGTAQHCCLSRHPAAHHYLRTRISLHFCFTLDSFSIACNYSIVLCADLACCTPSAVQQFIQLSFSWPHCGFLDTLYPIPGYDPYTYPKGNGVSRVWRVVPALQLFPDAEAVDALCERCAAALLAATHPDTCTCSLACLWADALWRAYWHLYR